MAVDYSKWYVRVADFLLGKVASRITWNPIRALFNHGVYYSLTEADHNQLRELLSSGYYIILTNRKSHLTTYFIGIANLVKTGKWSQYGHSFMNVDKVNDPKQWDKFMIMEATGTGVHWSTFMQVFDVDGVCLLRPKNFTNKTWSITMEMLLEQEGKPYDNLFDLADSTHESCVEMVRNVLRGSKTYEQDYPNFEAMIKKVGNLTPQMFRDCEDFEVVLEIRR